MYILKTGDLYLQYHRDGVFRFTPHLEKAHQYTEMEARDISAEYPGEIRLVKL